MISYDVFVAAFLDKITEYDFITLDQDDRQNIVDGFMKRALSAFKKNCKYDFASAADDDVRAFDIDIADKDLDEIVEIVSEGMVLQWMKPYRNKQELLENLLNTRDYTEYSPANLLMRINETYNSVKNDYTQMIREYSYNHGDLSRLHI